MENFKSEGARTPSLNRLTFDSLTAKGEQKAVEIKESIEIEADAVATELQSRSKESEVVRDENAAQLKTRNAARAIRADEQTAKEAHSGLETERVFELLQ